MNQRRLAPRFCEFLAAFLFHLAMAGLCLPTAALAAAPEEVGLGASMALLFTLLSAATLVWGYHRRDYASPRRNGRRI